MSRESTIRDLRVKVKQLEAKKREIDKQVENLHGAIRVFEQNGDVEHVERSSYAREVSDAMLDILTSERPLHRNVILARVQERGIQIGGRKPVNTIGSYLSTDNRFRNTGSKGVWTLTEEPIGESIANRNGAMAPEAAFVTPDWGPIMAPDDLPF